ncbi:MAG: DNA polymerase III subunit delta [Pseudobacteriovorax sp.]|nr:DNA polymerase III subunit delta [Pseudobacteriovorax sp.]
MSFQRLTFNHYLQAMSSLGKKKDNPGFIICFGPSHFLVNKTIDKFVASNRQSYLKIHSEKITEPEFLEYLSQDTMFSESHAIVCEGLEKKSRIWSTISNLPEKTAIRNQVLLVSKSNTIPKAIAAFVKKQCVLQIPCHDPNQFELPKFLVGLAKKHKLTIQQDAAKFLMQTVGHNLTTLENEIKRLGLIFNENEGPLDQEKMAPYLDCLKEDHAFALDNFLVAKQPAKAMLLVHDLLLRNANHLGILAILRNHCIKALKIKAFSRQGLSQQEMKQHMKMPPRALQNFVNYCQATKEGHFKLALSQCHEADILFKTKSTSPELKFNQIIGSLMGIY